jgi:hypothetical protein
LPSRVKTARGHAGTHIHQHRTTQKLVSDWTFRESLQQHCARICLSASGGTDCA